MLRKLFTSAALGLSLTAPLAAPSVAKADYWPRHERHYHRHYEVFYRHDCYCQWRCAGRYDCREDAERVACRFRERGFEVRVCD
jgi:hypothetical protein